MTVEVVEFVNERSEYQALCYELKEVSQLRKEAEAKEKELKARIVEIAGGDRMEFGVRVSLKERKGSFDMKAVFTDMNITHEEGEKYRKEGSTYWDVRGY